MGQASLGCWSSQRLFKRCSGYCQNESCVEHVSFSSLNSTSHLVQMIFFAHLFLSIANLYWVLFSWTFPCYVYVLFVGLLGSVIWSISCIWSSFQYVHDQTGQKLNYVGHSLLKTSAFYMCWISLFSCSLLNGL